MDMPAKMKFGGTRKQRISDRYAAFVGAIALHICTNERRRMGDQYVERIRARQ